MGLRVDFNRLKNVVKDANSKNNNVKDTNVVLTEYMNTLANFIATCNQFKEDELAMLSISLQNWTVRKDRTIAGFPYNVGDIVYADLGLTYKLELAYPHPVVILENVGNLVLVAPTTTSQELLNEAYHPIDNKEGNKYLRKVNKGEDNFEETCVVLISNIRTVNPSRLLNKLDTLKVNISDPESLFVEIKEKMFEYYLPKLFNSRNKLNDEIKLKQDKIDELESEVIELKNKIFDLEKQIDQNKTLTS